MTVKTDFLISPAYLVPPIKIIRRAKLTRMNVDERVPSRAGSAWKSAASTTVNSGSKLGLGPFGHDEQMAREESCAKRTRCTTRTGSR